MCSVLTGSLWELGNERPVSEEKGKKRQRLRKLGSKWYLREISVFIGNCWEPRDTHSLTLLPSPLSFWAIRKANETQDMSTFWGHAVIISWSKRWLSHNSPGEHLSLPARKATWGVHKLFLAISKGSAATRWQMREYGHQTDGWGSGDPERPCVSHLL